MAREVLSNGVINPDKYQADWYADLSNNWNLLNDLIGSAISGSEVDSKIATAIQELMVRTFQIVTELPQTGTEGVMYLVAIPDTSKYTAYVWENSAYRELGVIQMTITIDDELSTTSENPVQNKVITNALGDKASSSHTHSASDITSGLSAVATSGSYNDLSNKPTIPTVNNGTLTIQKNGTTVDTFTANSSTDKTVNISVPTNTSELTNGAGYITADYAVPRSGGAVISGDNLCKTVNTSRLSVRGGVDTNGGATITMYGKDWADSAYKGAITLGCYDGSNSYAMKLYTNGSLTWGTKNVAMQEDVVPRSGGAVITGSLLASSTTNSVGFGHGWGNGGTIYTHSSTYSAEEWQGTIKLEPFKTGANFKTMILKPDGTWTWNGTACQITSDQRYKQQIAEIDDKLLDAWQDVNLVQFKYNDAVDQKKDKARLHTGYVVQQIDSACKSHNVDISEYGLYCHEEYPEETEEVEIEQADGTKVKETKVIREASEHYSLRYTEALIVECAYLRKKLKELTARIEQLESSK